MRENAPIGRIVLDNQNALAGQPRRRLHEGRRGGHRTAAAEVDGERELRTGAAPAAHGDRAAHQFHQLLADRQAQAGAAVAPRGDDVALFEDPEKPFDDVRGHADSGVADRDAQADRIRRRRRLRIAVDAQQHFPGFGELDRVAEQIGQHLAQAAGVADQRGGYFGRDLVGEFHPLLVGARSEQLGDILDQRRELEFLRLQLELSGFDL